MRSAISTVALLLFSAMAAATDALPITAQSDCMEGPVAQFGRYIGQWRIEDEQLQQDGSTWAPGTAERWDFYCVGNGEAVQDFWLPKGGNVGTNLRTWNPTSEQWEIAWTATLSPGIAVITAKQQPDGRIVMHYKDPVPDPLRRITFYPPDAEGWRWTLEFSNDGGENWFEVYRIKASPAS